jgi:DDE superfamily endonuclease
VSGGVQVGATSYLADEAGVRSDDHAGTTWAPVGHTPVVATTGDRFGVNLISAVTAKGRPRSAGYEGGFNGPVFIDFCRRLLPDASAPVFLVLDGHPVHAGVTGPDDLKAKALAALHRLQMLPQLVGSFFRDPNLRYITA